jgi:hypothetical protein
MPQSQPQPPHLAANQSSRPRPVQPDARVAMHSFLVTSGTQDRKKGSGRGPRGRRPSGQRLIFESKNRVLFQLLSVIPMMIFHGLILARMPPFNFSSRVLASSFVSSVTIRYSSVMMICNQDIKEILSKMESHNLFTSFVCNVCFHLALIFVSVAGATQTLTYQKFAHPRRECGSSTKQLTNFPLVGTCHLGNVIKHERTFSLTVAGEAIHALFVII